MNLASLRKFSSYSVLLRSSQVASNALCKGNARHARTKLSILPRPWPAARPAVSNAPKSAMRVMESRAVPRHATVRLEEIPEFIELTALLMDALKNFPEARQAVVEAIRVKANE